MTTYRGHLDPPLANAPEGFTDEVRRLLRYGGAGVAATAVCQNQHPLVVVVDTPTFGLVATWVRAARATIDGTAQLLGGTWAATIRPPEFPYCKAKCRCTTAVVDIERLLVLAAGTKKRRVSAAAVRPSHIR